MLHALRTRDRDDRDAGFTLIEILVAMVLMGIIMSSLAVFFIGAQKSSNALRSRQNAAVLGDQAMDKVHSIAVAKLLTGRDQSSSDAQWASPVTGVDLSTMTELYDTTSTPLPPAGNGAIIGGSANLPTVPVPQTVNTVPFSTSYYIGQCYIPHGGGDCVKVKPASDAIPMYRVIAAVTWKDKSSASTCPAHTCAYVVASLISSTTDPTFNVNQVVVDTTPPTTPSSLSCSKYSNAAAGGDVGFQSLSWSPASDASGVARYDVYRGTTNVYSDMTLVKSAATSGWSDSGLDPLTTYYYAVVAIDTVGNVSAPQVPVGTVTNPQSPFMTSCDTVADTVKPTPPTISSSFTSTSNTTTFSWSGATDDYKIGGYQVFRNGVLIATPPAGTLTWTDSGLSPWVTYNYTVASVDTSGNISATTSAIQPIKTKDTVAPSAPTGLNAVNPVGKPLEIDLDWTDSTDDVGVTGYQVYRGTSAGSLSLVGSPTTSSFANTGLASSTLYYFAVYALDAAGNKSAVSTPNPYSLATPDSIAPTTPTGVTSPSKTATSVTLSWTASTDAVGVTGYKIYRGGVLVGTSTTPTFTDTGLTQLTSYSYTVTANDAAANVSGTSTPYSVTTADGTPPSTPTLSAGAKNYTALTLNWTAASDNIAVTGYAIYRNGGTTPVGTVSGSTYTYTDTGLTSSTAYTYTVKAYDAAGNYSAASNSVGMTTYATPSKVTGLAGTTGGSKTTTLSWAASTDSVGITGYRVYVSGVLKSSPTVLTYTLSGLNNNTAYPITLYAVDAAGFQSPVSVTLTCTTNNAGTVVSCV